jgi:hypothetical protein
VRDARICSGRRYNDKTDNLENGSHVKVTAHVTGSTEQGDCQGDFVSRE